MLGILDSSEKFGFYSESRGQALGHFEKQSMLMHLNIR